MKLTKENVFLIVCIMGFLAILSSTMSKSPVLPYFADYLKTPQSWQEGLVFSASTIPGILISLPAGSLSDIVGRRKVLVVSGFLFASAPFFYLFVNIWWELALVRFYHGFATGMFVPVAQAMIAEAYPARRGERISLFSSVTTIGRSLAPLLGAYILIVTNPGLEVGQYTNFQGLYVAVGAAGTAAFITALPFLRGNKPAAKLGASGKIAFDRVAQGWISLARTRGVLVVSLVEAGQYYVYGSVESYLVKYMKDFTAIGGFPQGVVLFSLVIIVMLSKPFIGRFSDRAGRRTPIVLGCVVSSIPLVLMPLSTQFPILLVLAMIYGLGFSMVTSSTPAMVSEFVPIEKVGGAMGFISTLMDVGQTFGPIVCGFILGASLGYISLFASLSLVLMVTVFMFALVKIGKPSSMVTAHGDYQKLR
jgi:MFS family permease